MKLADARGDWALVTGASEGIGLEFCRQLAAAGLNVAMVARREELCDRAREIAEAAHVRTLPIRVDLTEAAAGETIERCLAAEQARLRLLCNNAGSGRLEPFGARPREAIERELLLNVHAVVVLSLHFLPELARNAPSAVVNVSSPAALQPMPGYALYAAEKAFVHAFSQALYGEWSARRVHVQTLVPAPTATAFDRKSGAWRLRVGRRVPPEEVVRLSLENLDRDRPVVSNAPGLARQKLFSALAPSRMVIRTVERLVRSASDDAR